VLATILMSCSNKGPVGGSVGMSKNRIDDVNVVFPLPQPGVRPALV
jgi:hypothetical protein